MPIPGSGFYDGGIGSRLFLWDWKVRQHFDTLAPVFDKHKESHYYSVLERTLQRFLPSNCLVLDLGCGSGKLLRDLFPHGIGVDLSSRLIEFAYNKDTNHDYLVADVKYLPFRGARFPAIVCVDLLEHIDDTEQLLDEVQRVVKMEGIIVITVINYLFWPLFELLELLKLKLPEGPHRWVRAGSIVSSLDERGFFCTVTNFYFGLINVIVAQKKDNVC